MLPNVEPEFGTVRGRQTPVNRSSSSPAGHWASGTEDGDRRGCGDRDRKSAGKDQPSY
jgi:hypothetical protein